MKLTAKTVGQGVLVLVGIGAALDGISAAAGGERLSTIITPGAPAAQTIVVSSGAGDRVAAIALDVLVVAGCVWGFRYLGKK